MAKLVLPIREGNGLLYLCPEEPSIQLYLVSHHHYRYLSSYLNLQLYTELHLNMLPFPPRILSTQQPTYSFNMLNFSDIFRTLRSPVSKQRFVPKTKLNIGKRAFSVAAPTIWNKLPITVKSSETIDIFRKKIEKIFL